MKSYRWNWRKCLKNIALLAVRFVVIFAILCILGIDQICIW